jgi:hypothetical protein
VKSFCVKALGTGIPAIECKYHVSAETKELAEVEFKRLMPTYTIIKTKEVQQPEVVAPKEEEKTDGYR